MKAKAGIKRKTNSEEREVAISGSVSCTANEGPVIIQYKCLVPIYVFPEMKLCGLVVFKTEI
jgi:hypothetical protein